MVRVRDDAEVVAELTGARTDVAQRIIPERHTLSYDVRPYTTETVPISILAAVVAKALAEGAPDSATIGLRFGGSRLVVTWE